jgi:hypothetical protein
MLRGQPEWWPADGGSFQHIVLFVKVVHGLIFPDFGIWQA